MVHVTTTVSEQIDIAIEGLPHFRRKMIQRHYARKPEEREALEDAMMASLAKDPEIETLGFGTAFSSGRMSARDPFSIDMDKLEKFLQLIIKYLPTLLEILLPLFLRVGPVILLAVLLTLPSNTYAQEPQNRLLQATASILEVPIRATSVVAATIVTAPMKVLIPPSQRITTVRMVRRPIFFGVRLRWAIRFGR